MPRAVGLRGRGVDLVERARLLVDEQHVAVAVALGSALDRDIFGDRVGARVALVRVVERHCDAWRVAVDHRVRDADRPAVPEPRSEVGLQRSRIADRSDIRARPRVDRELRDVRVPDVVVGEQRAPGRVGQPRLARGRHGGEREDDSGEDDPAHRLVIDRTRARVDPPTVLARVTRHLWRVFPSSGSLALGECHTPLARSLCWWTCGGGRLDRRSGGAVMRRIWLVVVAVALLGAACGGASGPGLGAGDAVVKRVVDGDTIVVHVGGRDERVRLIGIDTPETVDPRKPVQCFGKEAVRPHQGAAAGGHRRTPGARRRGPRSLRPPARVRLPGVRWVVRQPRARARRLRGAPDDPTERDLRRPAEGRGRRRPPRGRGLVVVMCRVRVSSRYLPSRGNSGRTARLSARRPHPDHQLRRPGRMPRVQRRGVRRTARGRRHERVADGAGPVGPRGVCAVPG